ncbi:glycoside hydrolase family 43 protein [Aquibacillus rhizosphaerae]|uniref:Glycoside hydrolase 43 family protein n=1 Tax=Aquibacillus rhizosphaerae TaxID=3051431 RepID=A0ABT7L353_9BACI|nr:glycoside hydrolase 43 family protein [Aquibacillus sp. LR5S19]MDL4840279.1 glycoside hydrolase 43 family protein [Aquibacillus sp. LR5S19]
MKETNNVWVADLGNGYYQNPIIHADYSDPDVIRVGDDFFMVASSFNMSPCLPILHSKNLVNWEIINYVSDTFPDSSYELPRHGDGVWAPSIRYHDGKYWVFIGAPDEGIYMSTTDDPFGEWSPLHLVKKAKGWIDPCPFWDNDGNAYLVHAFARSRAGIKHILQVCKMKPDGTELLDEGRYIFDGTENHPTIEGPKMYKRNGYYYIFAPAGGVATGWQTVLRSKSVYGPYEDKIVLEQGQTDVNGPHQGGWVGLESGESWFIHFQDKGAYGRITHLQPMSWENDWPIMGTDQDENGVGEPVLEWKKPSVSIENKEVTVPQMSDDFTGETLGLQWQWKANVNNSWYTLLDNRLRLHAVSQPNYLRTLYDLPNIVTQKFPSPTFKATTKLTFKPASEDDCLGFIVTGRQYSSLKVKKIEGNLTISKVTGNLSESEVLEDVIKLEQSNKVNLYLQVVVDIGAKCQFTYSTDGEHFIKIGDSFVATPGQWIGSQVGMFCVKEGISDSSGYTDVHWFKIHK